ncbi:hypothetical protein HK405_006533, partial [Cladochytrium tenue]
TRHNHRVRRRRLHGPAVGRTLRPRLPHPRRPPRCSCLRRPILRRAGSSPARSTRPCAPGTPSPAVASL